MLMSILKSGRLKKTALWILTIAITLSSFVSVPISFGVLAEESGIPFLEIKPGAAWTSVIYRADTLSMSARGYYKFSFDYKVTSGNPVFQIQGYDATNQKYVALADLCSVYDEQDVVENNIMKRVITLRVKSTSFTGIMITLGAYTEANDIGCVVANPELYRYTNNTYSILHSGMTGNLLNDMSEYNIYDVTAEDPVHKSNQEGKWNLRYLTGKRGNIVCGALTKDEYAEMFAPPKYMIRLYEGNQNTDIEYIDRELDLQPGTYTLDCQYKSSVKTADFTVAVSNDNGATFQNVNATVTDSDNSKRKVQFTLSEAANGLKITVGNLTDCTAVSVAFANPTLVRSGENDSLIRSITADAVALIGLTDALTDETWNVRRDSENAEAVGVCKIPDGYFSDEKESLLYETYAGYGWTSILYSDESVFLSAGKSYLFTADFKLKSGSLSNDQIGVTYDPFFGILVDTRNTAGYGIDIYISTKNADYFNGVTTEFDEAQGKVFIRFSPKDDLKGVMIRVGNYCETPIGSCAIANPKLMEYTTKLNGVTVYGDTMIKNITEDTVVNPKEGKSANSELGKWNTIHLNDQNAFQISVIGYGDTLYIHGYNNHSYSEWQVITPFSCVNDGLERRMCLACGQTEDRVVSAHHTEQILKSVKPTCTAQGYDLVKCTACGLRYQTNQTQALGHDWAFLQTVVPNCSEWGYDLYHCVRCGETYQTNYTAVLGHDCRYISTVVANCVKAGYHLYHCDRCGEDVKTMLPAQGHLFEEGFCLDCGVSEEIAPFDLNGDAELNAEDLAELQSVLLRDEPETACDVNGDGVTNILDLIFMKKKLAD